MDQQQGQQRAEDKEQTVDVANNEVGPTEKLREVDRFADTLIPSVPGAQNPASEEIKDEKAPNTE